jgi:hypothetical protein
MSGLYGMRYLHNNQHRMQSIWRHALATASVVCLADTERNVAELSSAYTTSGGMY